MEEALKDAINCLNIIRGNKINSNFGQVYRNTNENLSKILTHYDMKDKQILSVVASSDQVFSCYYLGAKKVDTFDSNKLTYYYFFLKKWTLLSTGKPYIPASNIELLKIIETHDDSLEEINASYFWKYVILQLDESLYYSKFFYKEGLLYDLPYQNDIQTLQKILVEKKPNYQQINLFNPIQNVTQKYQVIILSNILEYLYNDTWTSQYQSIAAKNINQLLENGGIAISSNLIDYEYQGNPIFEHYFEYLEGPIDKNYFDQTEYPICYCYKKKGL